MMMAFMRGSLNLEGNMVSVSIHLKMDPYMMVIGIIIRYLDWGSMCGQMAGNILVNGRRIRWKALEFMSGRVGESIWGSTFKIVSQDMGFICILMGEFILATFKKVKCMV